MRKNLPLQLTPVTLVVLFSLYSEKSQAVTSHDADTVQDIASNVEFDPSFLNLNNSQHVDLSRFANGAAMLPGTYRSEIYINGELLNTSDVTFITDGEQRTRPCLSQDIVKTISFNPDKLPGDFFADMASGARCLDLEKKLPEARVSYDSSEQRLNVLIPQIYMLKSARGSVSPALWDSGIPAGMLGYSLNGYNSTSHGQTYRSFYAGLNAGLNIGAWYLRHNGSYNWMDNGPEKYDTINTYLQRDIPVIKGRMLAGQSNTNGQVFDTLSFSGVQLASDERMLPESQRGYAPDIHGIARTNARVTVRQSNQVIYETTVSPGEFLIDDLYPTGYGGDLVVTVREADGSESTFLVPYASVTQLLRPGTSRYAATVGKIRSDTLHDKPALYQATYQRGLTNAITGYGGVQASQDYYAIQLGAAFGSPVGAFSFDATQARTRLDASTDSEGNRHAGKNMSGQSYQISYSKTISETNSNLSLAAYRFSTSGYMDFMTGMQTRDAVSQGYSPETIWRAKNRFTLTAGQGLSDGWGQLYASGSLQNYWNKEGSDKQFQMGYSNQYRRLTYGISVNRSYSSYGNTQNNYLLSFSFPLGRSDMSHTPQMRVDLNHDSNGRYGEQTTLSGSAGADNQFSYGVSAMHANQNAGTSASLSGQYRNGKTNMNATYSTGKNYHSMSGGLNGSVIAHSGGLTLTPYTSETFALVEARGAEGASVSSYPGVYIDSRGFAAVPYLNPYQMNEISLDPKGASGSVELDNTSQKVAPYAGAVVKVKYGTRTGVPLLINATYQGEPVPFGADVLDENGNSVGSVGQGGQIYARVTDTKGQLKVTWGNQSGMQCLADYQLPPQKNSNIPAQLQRLNSVCQPVVMQGQESGAVVASHSPNPLGANG